MALSEGEIASVKGMLLCGDRQHDIAAYFGVNGGRIAEISTGQTGASVSAAPADDLPLAGPYMAGRSELRTRHVMSPAQFNMKRIQCGTILTPRSS